MSNSFMMLHGNQLVANGFPILPIVPGKKFPGQYLQGRWLPYKGWTKHAFRATTELELSTWKQWPEAGIGIPGGMIAGIDIDVTDEAISEQLSNIALQLLGSTQAIRIGCAPKQLLVYRTNAPFKGVKAHPLEVLCLGQQFVAYAIHPGTGQPYQWPKTSLTDLRIEDLPVITEAQAHAFIEQGLAILPESMRPNRLAKEATNRVVNSSKIDHYSPPAIHDQRGTYEAVADALRHIINADLPYDDWIRIGMAVKGAIGEEGASLFFEWSSSSRKNITGITAKTWDGFQPSLIGAGTLYHLAQKNGWRPHASITLNPANKPLPGPHPAAELLRSVQQNLTDSKSFEQEKTPFLEGPTWDPTDLDGVLGMLVNHMLETATRPQPILAVGNALCALGALMGWRYRTETDLRTNLYIVGIAESGSGKNHSREIITNLFHKAGLQSFLGGNRIASGTGLLRAVFDHPSILFQQDEFGMFLQAAADRRRSPRHITDILDLMTELYSSASTIFLGPEYAIKDKEGRKDICQPCLSLYGTTTPVMFWSALKSSHVADGSMARLLVLKTQDDYPDEIETNTLRDIPDQLVQAALSITKGGSMGSGNLQGITARPSTPATPMVVPMDQGAKTLFGDLSTQVMSKLRETRASPWSALLARVWENAVKVALVRGASADPFNPVIRQNDAAWAIGLVRYAVNTIIQDVEQHMADNQTEQNHKKMIDIIRRAGCKGVTLGNLSQKARFVDRRTRLEIIQTLVESGQVIEGKINGKTKPSMIYKMA